MENKIKPDSMLIKCKDCGNDFEFTKGEQDFFQQRGLYPPKRCPTCRMKRKKEQQNGK